jgi:hypothetical protein
MEARTAMKVAKACGGLYSVAAAALMMMMMIKFSHKRRACLVSLRKIRLGVRDDND